MTGMEFGGPGSLAERVLGISDAMDSHEALVRAHCTLTGELVNADALLARDEADWQVLSDLSKKDEDLTTLDPEFVENTLCLRALRDLLVNPKLGHNTFLHSWPSFEEMYRQAVPNALTPPSAIPKKALMLGSLSALSSAAFAAFSHDVLGAEPHIIDTRASAAKLRHGNFTFGNALDMPPAWADTMTTIHSNLLVHMILDEQNELVRNEQTATQLQTLAQQMFSVLTPDGRVFMRESPGGYDYSDRECQTPHNQGLVAELKNQLSDALQGAGFTDITIGTAWNPRDPSFIFDPHRDFSSKPPKSVPFHAATHARKPA